MKSLQVIFFLKMADYTSSRRYFIKGVIWIITLATHEDLKLFLFLSNLLEIKLTTNYETVCFRPRYMYTFTLYVHVHSIQIRMHGTYAGLGIHVLVLCISKHRKGKQRLATCKLLKQTTSIRILFMPHSY